MGHRYSMLASRAKNNDERTGNGHHGVLRVLSDSKFQCLSTVLLRGKLLLGTGVGEN